MVAENQDNGKPGSHNPGSLILKNSQGGTYVVAFHSEADLEAYLSRSAQPLPAALAPTPAPVPPPLPSAATVSDSMLAALWQSDLGVAPSAADLASMRAMANAGYTVSDVRTSIAASSQAISAIGGLYTSLTGSTASGAAIQGYER